MTSLLLAVDSYSFTFWMFNSEEHFNFFFSSSHVFSFIYSFQEMNYAKILCFCVPI